MNAPAQSRAIVGLGDLRIPGAGRLTIGDIALGDPRLAYSLLGSMWARDYLLPGGIVDAARLGACCAWGWEMIDVGACFTVGDCGKRILGVHCDISGEILIRQVKVTVRRPNAFSGNIFKPQSDHFNAENPNINVELEIDSFCRHLISSTPVPLENIEVMFDCECPPLIILKCYAKILAYFTLRRALAPSELPMDVHITFHGIRLPVSYSDCRYDEAVGFLNRHNVCCGPGLADHARVPRLLGEAGTPELPSRE